MKAFLLAAGEGTRLRPLTEKITKCLLLVGGKPLLEIWLELCQKHGIKEVLINGHHLAYQIEDYIGRNKTKFNLKINYVYEKEFKGTGGTVRDNFDFVRNEDFFFIFHSDVFTNINLTEFKNFHIEKNSPLTIAMCYTKTPKASGLIEGITDEGLITAFREKPEDPKSNLASAALFITSPEVEKDFPKEGNFDFSKEILPKYVGKMYGFLIDGFHVNVGTPEKYELANKLTKELKNN